MTNKDTLKEKLEDDFIEFWDTHADKLGLGKYSSEITRFWLDKIEQTRKEERERIERIAHEMLPMLNTVKKDLRFWQGFRKGIELLINNIKSND